MKISSDVFTADEGVPACVFELVEFPIVLDDGALFGAIDFHGWESFLAVGEARRVFTQG
jgi:hypothetical protein